MANEPNRPVKKFQAGGVSAAVWKNTMALANGQGGANLSVTMDRRYKDKDGVWKTSGSMRLNDLPKAILVLGKADEFLTSGVNENGEAVVEEEVVW